MSKASGSLKDEMLKLRPAIDAAHAKANREALLVHARTGRSVCEGGENGQVVWITLEEIFARYGLDENGKPKA